MIDMNKHEDPFLKMIFDHCLVYHNTNMIQSSRSLGPCISAECDFDFDCLCEKGRYMQTVLEEEENKIKNCLFTFKHHHQSSHNESQPSNFDTCMQLLKRIL